MNDTDTAALVAEARGITPTWHRGMYGCPQDMYGANVIVPLVGRLADALEAATSKDSLTVRTVEELDALPDGTYILTAYTFDRDKEPLILRRGPDWGLIDKHDLYWWTTDGGDQISSLDRVDDTEHLVLPATVLWTPEETGR